MILINPADGNTKIQIIEHLIGQIFCSGQFFEICAYINAFYAKNKCNIVDKGPSEP